MIIQLPAGRGLTVFFVFATVLSFLMAVLPAFEALEGHGGVSYVPPFAHSRLSAEQLGGRAAPLEPAARAPSAGGDPADEGLPRGAVPQTFPVLSTLLRQNYRRLAAWLRSRGAGEAGEGAPEEPAAEEGQPQQQGKEEEGEEPQKQEQPQPEPEPEPEPEPVVSGLWAPWAAPALDVVGDTLRLTVVVESVRDEAPADGAPEPPAERARVHVLERPVADFAAALRARGAAGAASAADASAFDFDAHEAMALLQGIFDDTLGAPPARGQLAPGDWTLLYGDTLPAAADAHARDALAGWVAVAYRELADAALEGQTRARVRVYDAAGRHADVTLPGEAPVAALAVLPPLFPGDACAVAYARNSDAVLFRTLRVRRGDGDGAPPAVERVEGAAARGPPVKGARTEPRSTTVSLQAMRCTARLVPCLSVTRHIVREPSVRRIGFVGLVVAAQRGEGEAGGEGEGEAAGEGEAGPAGLAPPEGGYTGWSAVDKGWRSKASPATHNVHRRPALAVSSDRRHLALVSSPYVASADDERSHAPVEIVNLEADTHFVATGLSDDGLVMAIGDNHGLVLVLTRVPDHDGAAAGADEQGAAADGGMQWQVAMEFRLPRALSKLSIRALAVVSDAEAAAAADPAAVAFALAAGSPPPGTYVSVLLDEGVVATFDVGERPPDEDDFEAILIWWDYILLGGAAVFILSGLGVFGACGRRLNNVLRRQQAARQGRQAQQARQAELARHRARLAELERLAALQRQAEREGADAAAAAAAGADGLRHRQ